MRKYETMALIEKAVVLAINTKEEGKWDKVLLTLFTKDGRGFGINFTDPDAYTKQKEEFPEGCVLVLEYDKAEECKSENGTIDWGNGAFIGKWCSYSAGSDFITEHIYDTIAEFYEDDDWCYLVKDYEEE